MFNDIISPNVFSRPASSINASITAKAPSSDAARRQSAIRARVAVGRARGRRPRPTSNQVAVAAKHLVAQSKPALSCSTGQAWRRIRFLDLEHAMLARAA
jgi:hypothetical protein